MREQTIIQFLTGEAGPSEVNQEALASIERVDGVRERIFVQAGGVEFVVTREMLLRLCEAAIAHEIDPVALRAIAFAMVTSPDMEWGEDLVGEVIHDWSSPEVNIPLNQENLVRFRRWLSDEETYPAKASIESSKPTRLKSETTRVDQRP